MFQIVRKCNFSIEKKIGSGANSIVYQGKLKGKNVAIKQLINDHVKFNDYLNNELNILRKLQSKQYFIDIFGISRVQNKVYIFMEYFEYDLLKYIHKDNFWKRSIKYNDKILPRLESFYYFEDNFYWNYTMKRGEKIYITKQLLNALNVLHEMNIIHGDIKSENFVYMNNILKMIDFNTATDLQKGNEINIECKYGTEGYISPEQYDYKLSYKSDIYSICITILELWCGKIWIEDTINFKKNRNQIMKSLRILEKGEIKLSKIIRKNISLKEKNRNKSIGKIIIKINEL